MHAKNLVSEAKRSGIVGWRFSEKAEARIAVEALEDAVYRQQPPKGLIIHTDQGSQYTSAIFEQACSKMGLRHSYSAKGTPLDNAPIESFHAILKKEEVYAKIYKKVDDARQSLFRYIEGFYNMRRIHSALGYRSPIEYENIMNNKAS